MWRGILAPLQGATTRIADPGGLCGDRSHSFRPPATIWQPSGLQASHPDNQSLKCTKLQAAALTSLVSVAKLEEPYWLPLSRDFGSPLPTAGEGLGVRGCTRQRFSETTQEAHPMGDGVDLSLTAIPLTPDPLSPLGRGEPRIALGAQLHTRAAFRPSRQKLAGAAAFGENYQIRILKELPTKKPAGISGLFSSHFVKVQCTATVDWVASLARSSALSVLSQLKAPPLVALRPKWP